jgi:hypothetical protein
VWGRISKELIMYAKLIPAISTLLLLSATPAVQATVLSSNLIVNPGAETDVGAPNITTSVVAPFGWSTTSNFTAVQYAAGGAADLNPAISAAVGGGNNYFAGGPNTPLSSASQRINISDLSSSADAGLLSARLSGLLGGFGGQSDNMIVQAMFRNASNNLLDTLTIGPVTASDRDFTTTLLPRQANGVLPAGTRSIDIVMTATRPAGNYNDAYADNVALVLNAIPEADAFICLAAGLAALGLARARLHRTRRKSGNASA